MWVSTKATRIFCLFAFAFVAIGGGVLLYTGGNVTGAVSLLVGIAGIAVTFLMTRQPAEAAGTKQTGSSGKDGKKKGKRVTIADMYQFPDIPFVWRSVAQLSRTNGMAWFPLERDNRQIARDYISQISVLLDGARENLKIKGIAKCVIDPDKTDFDVPSTAKKDGVNRTFVECTPYTPTGEIWTYPAALHFELSDHYEYAGNRFPYQPCSGVINILRDGNIGAAEVFFFTGKIRFQIVRSGARLVITGISADGNVLYESEEKGSLSHSADGIIIPPKEMSYLQKERFMVEHLTAEDMLQFTGMPYNLNAPLVKVIQQDEQSSAHINLDKSNRLVAKAELETLNRLIQEAEGLDIAQEFLIRVDAIVFSEEGSANSLTRLLCTPYTFTGKLERYPLSLLFISDLDAADYQASGRINYTAGGKSEKAVAHITVTLSPDQPAQSRIFYFETVDKQLTLYKVEATGDTDGDEGQVIYQHKQLAALQAGRAQDEQDYAWLQTHLPEACPKSLTAFRRMKAQNTPSYQALQQLAAQLGQRI